MTDPADDDVSKLADISKELPAIDLDQVTSERMAHRLRQDLGKGPSLRRFILPIIAGVAIAIYGVWTLLKVLEVLG